MARTLSLHLVYHKNEAIFAEELVTHLSIPSGMFEITKSPQVPVGQNVQQWKLERLENSDLIVLLSSRDLINSDDYLQLEKFINKNSLIPIKAGLFSYKETYLRDIKCYPRNDKALRSLKKNERDIEYVEIAGHIHRKAKSILERETRQHEETVDSTQTPARPKNNALSSTWALRSEYRKNFFAQKKESAPSYFLESLERELRKIPLLRITELDRYEWWLLCIDYLDHRNPKAKLKERLRSETKAEHNEREKWFAKQGETLKQPRFFCPEDTLAEVSRVWDDPKLAARWLYIGICFLGTQVSLYRNPKRVVDLHKYVKSYLDLLSPNERRHLELCKQLQDAKCVSLIAGFPPTLQKFPDNEVRRAIELLHTLRDGSPIQPVTNNDIKKAKSAVLLNLLGARALWLGQAAVAEQAYKRARAQAIKDSIPMAEWAAVEGLLVLQRWFKGSRANGRRTPRHERSVTGFLQMRDELRHRHDSIRYVQLFLNNRTQSVQAQQLTQLLSQLADDPEQLRAQPALLVSSNVDELEELVLDEEELGFPLPMIGEAATLVGTLRLLSGLPPGDPRLVDAVCLLIRYGAGGIDDKYKFFSPSIHPSRGDFMAVWKAVLKPMRSLSEGLAKISFLKRYAKDLPIDLLDETRKLCVDLLAQIHRSANHGVLHYLRGSNFGEHAAWDILKDLSEECALIAGHCVNKGAGIGFIIELLDNNDPQVWSKALTVLYICAWSEWVDIGAVSRELLTILVDKLIARLQSHECKALHGDGSDTRLFVGIRDIPLGIAKLLHACRKARVPSKKIEKLHDNLCSLLSALLNNEKAFYYQTFFSNEIFNWLSKRRDKKTKRFVQEKIDSCLDFLNQSKTDSLYFDTWGTLAEEVDALSNNQSKRLVAIINSQGDRLQKAAGSGSYPTMPLLAFAARILKSKHASLHKWAQDLIWGSTPTRHGLVCLLAAPPHRLGDSSSVIERAIFHCLLGLAQSPWPWFGAQAASPPRREWRDASEDGVQDALHAVHDALFFGHALPSGFRVLMVPTVAQIYSHIAKVAEAAVRTLELALQKSPEAVDLTQAVHALCWAMTRPERSLRDAAIRTVARHQERLNTCPAWPQLSGALQRFASPTTLSTVWALNMGRLAAAKDAKESG